MSQRIMQNHITFIFFSHIIFISINFANAQQKCLDTAGYFTANSTYANNRYQILSSLAPNVSANNDRFFNTSIGEEPNKVYALGLCVRDTTPESCFNCVYSTSQRILEKCPNQKGAIFWEGVVGGPCLVRYANSSFFRILELEPLEANSYKTGGVSFNRTEFDPIWEALMERVVKRASSGSSRVKYATEEAEAPPFQKIYAQMQCTPDLSPSDCSKCLRENVASYQDCCYGRLGGYAQRPSCTFRWDMISFYNASVSPPAPPPPPSNSPPVTTNAKEDDDGGIKSGTVAAIVVPTITFIAFFALTCIFLIRRRRKPSQEIKNADEVASVESLQFDLGTIRNATNNFADANKLGQGGFGAVYKVTASAAAIASAVPAPTEPRDQAVTILNDMIEGDELSPDQYYFALEMIENPHFRRILMDMLPCFRSGFIIKKYDGAGLKNV